MSELSLSQILILFSRYKRTETVPDGVPADVSILYLDPRLVAHSAKYVVQCVAPVRIRLSSEPERVHVLIHLILLSLIQPSRQRFCGPIGEANNPVVDVFRTLLFRNSENSVLYINPFDSSTLYFNWTQASVECSPNERRKFPGVRSVKIIGANIDLGFHEPLCEIYFPLLSFLR